MSISFACGCLGVLQWTHRVPSQMRACRNMWAEFEWENKVAVNTTFTDCSSFLNHIVATTNMQCLTPPTALDGERAARTWPQPTCMKHVS